MSFMVNARSSGASTSSGKLGGSSQVVTFSLEDLVPFDIMLSKSGKANSVFPGQKF